MTASKEQALAMLNEAHRFPGPFAFKAIGHNDAAFSAEAAQLVALVVGPKAPLQLSSRPSAKGNHQALTLTVHCQSAEQVLQIYDALKRVPGLKMLL